MLHVKKTLTMPFPLEHPQLEAAIKKNALIFDIETTGLNPHRDNVVLIGFIRFDSNGRPVMNQMFIDDPSEEAELLSAFYRISDSCGFYMTYNGNSFDLPFLNSRMKKHRQNCRFDSFYNIDIMRALRTGRFDLTVPDYKLKTIEKHMGISRSDQISGRESVELYRKYVEIKDPSLRDTILLHNSDDIINLFRLLAVFALTGNPETFFDFSSEFKAGDKTFRIRESKRVGTFVSVMGKCVGRQETDHTYNEALFSFESDVQNGDFAMRIPAIMKSMNGIDYSIIDYKSIPFARSGIESFIKTQPSRLLLFEGDKPCNTNIRNLVRIMLNEIF